MATDQIPATMEPVIVRRLTPADRVDWHILFRAYIEFYRATVSDDVVDDLWQRLLSGDEGEHIGWVAVGVDGAPVGLAHALFHRSTWSKSYYCYLEDLFVRQDRRQSGAGRALIDAVYLEADRRMATRTYWVTEENNYAARRLYDRVAQKSPFVQYRR